MTATAVPAPKGYGVLPASPCPRSSCLLYQRFVANDIGVVDRHVKGRREQAQRDRAEPEEGVGLGEVEHIAAEPNAQERAELVAEEDDAEQCRDVADAEDLRDEAVGQRNGA